MEQLKRKYDLDVEWRPFEIHPETPKEGALTDDLSFPEGYLERAFANVKRLADEDGIPLKFSDKLSNSHLALSISEFARKKGKFDEFHKLVLDTYWLQGRDIGNRKLLLDLAESIGMDKKEIESFLETDESRKALQKSLREIRANGINGVPAFIIDNKLIFGAQPYEVFDRAIKKAIEEKS